LAQITIFTTEYLEVKRGIFLMKVKTEKDETQAELCKTVMTSEI